MRSNILYILLSFLLLSGTGSPLYALEESTTRYRAGAALARAGDMDGAISEFEQAILLNPWYSLGHYGLGKAYLYREGRIDDAIRHLQIAVRLDRSLARGYFYLGMGYFFGGKLVSALKAFDTAYRLDDRIIESLYNMGVIYELMGKRNRSGYYYTRYRLVRDREGQGLFF